MTPRQVGASVEAYETALQIRLNCFGRNNLQVSRNWKYAEPNIFLF